MSAVLAAVAELELQVGTGGAGLDELVGLAIACRWSSTTLVARRMTPRTVATGLDAGGVRRGIRREVVGEPVEEAADLLRVSRGPPR